MKFAAQLAKIKAQEYADKHAGASNMDGTAELWAKVYSAYFAGYIQNCAETDALRAIVRRIEMKETKAPIVPADKLVNIELPPGTVALVQDAKIVAQTVNIEVDDYI